MIADEVYVEAAARKWVKGERNELLIQEKLPVDTAVARIAEQGAWVLAWVWVTQEEVEEVRNAGG